MFSSFFPYAFGPLQKNETFEIKKEKLVKKITTVKKLIKDCDFSKFTIEELTILLEKFKELDTSDFLGTTHSGSNKLPKYHWYVHRNRFCR
jgi:hypothetical protein